MTFWKLKSNVWGFFFNLNTQENLLKSKCCVFLRKIRQIFPRFAAGPVGNKGCLFYAFLNVA